jgi:hypothetical protein
MADGLGVTEAGELNVARLVGKELMTKTLPGACSYHRAADAARTADSC